MEERNVIAGMTATVLSGWVEFLGPLRWFFLLGLALILADLRFGIEAAIIRKERIRVSRALRRTIDKIVDYICWVFLAGAIGATFGTPFDVKVLPAMVMLVVYGIEINSCFSNYFEAKGKKIKVDVFKFFAKKADIIEIEKKENENTN